MILKVSEGKVDCPVNKCPVTEETCADCELKGGKQSVPCEVVACFAPELNAILWEGQVRPWFWPYTYPGKVEGACLT